MSANDAVVLTAAALEGNGIALLPSYAVAAALRAGTLVRVLDGFTVPTVWMKALVPGGSCRHSARAIPAHVPEGTLFPRAAMGQGSLTPPTRVLLPVVTPR